MKIWRLLAVVMMLCAAVGCTDEALDDELFFDDEIDEIMEEPAGDEAADESSAAETVSAAASSGDGAVLADEFDRFVEEMMDETRLPGAAVAVVYGGEVVLLKGYGFRDVANQLPATPETLFHIASTQKSITAMLVATLVDEGAVNWDTPLSEISPDFSLGGGGESITLRHLLSMSSGIPAASEDDFYDQGYGESADSLWPLLADTDPLGAPGEVFSYSNISSSMAGYAAVLALNPDAADLDEAYGALLFERVVRPIGMETAAFTVAEAEQNPNYGKSYVLDGGELVEAERFDIDGETLTPSGVMKASAAEMILYIQTHLNEGVAPNGTRIVSAENTKAMWETQIVDDGDGYAFGWGVTPYEGVSLTYHEGSYDNYESVIGFVPELGLGFVVLTNGSDVAVPLVEEVPWFLVDAVLDLE